MLANVTFTALFPKLPITGYSMSTPENDSTPSFAELGLAAPILQAVQQAGYETPSPIQAQSIPPLLAGRDLLGQAQTGTGKTAAV